MAPFCFFLTIPQQHQGKKKVHLVLQKKGFIMMYPTYYRDEIRGRISKISTKGAKKWAKVQIENYGEVKIALARAERL